MSEHDPLDPSLAALFRAEPEPAPPPLARARVLGRLEGSLGVMGAAAGGKVLAHGAHASAVGARLVGAIATTFVIGGVAGGIAVTALRPEPPARVVYVDRPVPALPIAAPIASAIPAPVPAPPGSSSAALHAPAPPIATDDLAAERMSLEDARGRLAGGDAPGALVRLQDHARRFPHGQLAEEREALAVQALVQTGRYDAARARAAQFRARWPNSVFLPAVDATLGSIP